MRYFRAGIVAAALSTLATFSYQTTAAELAAPKRTATTCTTFDSFPPVCGFVAQLTADELKTVQGFEQQHIEAYQKFRSTAPSSKTAPLAAPTRTKTTCTTFDNYPAVCGYVIQLTADELKIVQGFHQQHIEAYQNFMKTSK